LDAVLDKAIAEKRIVGAVVLVSLAGDDVYERAAGFADREARTPAHPNTVFRWSSLTKVVVATATLAR
jgi:CubicO group peptidase (beta-lactamase class C family)